MCFFNSAALGIILGIVLIGGAITLWLHKRKEIDAEMQLKSKPLFEKGIELKKKIVELEKFIES